MSLSEPHIVHAGLLKLVISRAGESGIIELHGELDLANAGVLEEALRKKLGDETGDVVVDMGGLTFIDSTGIALLVAAIKDDGNRTRLRFVHSQAAAVTRVLDLTGVAERLPTADGHGGDTVLNSDTR
ncbi:MAG TPA: STAS domain-containing protein [Solirubrobacterales bacterium]|nr:STAS domain-containing protein [Solirubrobacterales bacterium]